MTEVIDRPVAVRRRPDTAAPGRPGLVLALRCRRDRRVGPHLAPERRDPRRRPAGQPSGASTDDRAGLPPGPGARAPHRHHPAAARRAARGGGQRRRTPGCPAPDPAGRSRLGTDEPWTPLRRDLTEPVSDPDVRIEVIGPENADVRSAVQGASFDSSTFTDDRWHAMATGPAYAEACCLVAHDEHDTAVAAVTVWSAGPGNPASSNPPAPTSPPCRRTPRPASSPSWRSATVAGSRSRAERLELRVGQVDRRRGGVRVEVVDARGARDREYDGRPLQQPRERQL